jgi:hypothetical protein
MSSRRRSIDLDASFKLLNYESLEINFETEPFPLLISSNKIDKFFEDSFKF